MCRFLIGNPILLQTVLHQKEIKTLSNILTFIYCCLKYFTDCKLTIFIRIIYIAAQDAGRFKEEITPVPVKVKKEIVNFEIDEHPRPQTTIEGLKKLPTMFKKDGLVTAGSASVSIFHYSTSQFF